MLRIFDCFCRSLDAVNCYCRVVCFLLKPQQMMLHKSNPWHCGLCADRRACHAPRPFGLFRMAAHLKASCSCPISLDWGYNSIRNGPLKQMHSENTSQIPRNGPKSDSPTLQLQLQLLLLQLLLLLCLFTHRISTWQYLFITFEAPFPQPWQVLVHVQPFTWFQLELAALRLLSF